MARLHDLIDAVADGELRSQMAEALAELTQHRSYGLVFERHLPESAVIAGTIRPGDTVVSLDDPSVHGRVASTTGRKVSLKVEDSTVVLPADRLRIVRRFGEPIYPSLRHTGSIGTGGDRPHHVVIEAENYHALQLLTYTHRGKVDCIYLDPPYNTGDKQWRYNNAFVDNNDRYRHSKWLSMMERRLMLCKDLLRPDGVLIVTIDEHEVHRLGTLLDQVFSDHLCQTVTIVNNPKGTGKKNLARTNEYAIFVIPFKGEAEILGGLATPETSKAVVDEEEDEEGLFEEDGGEAVEEYSVANGWEARHARRRGAQSSYRHQRWGQFYPIFIDPQRRQVRGVGTAPPLGTPPDFNAPDGCVAVWPIDEKGHERCWRYVPPTMQRLIDQGRVAVGRHNKRTNNWTLNVWMRANQRKKPKTVWWDSRHDSGTHGSTLLSTLLDRPDAFPFPKSVYAVQDCLAAVCENRPDAVIVDVFAGSGTTTHATMLLNAEDGGRRTSILVSNNELGPDDETRLTKAGVKPGTRKWDAAGIFRSVTRPRIEAVVSGRTPTGHEIPGQHINGRPFAQGFDETVDFYELDLLDPYSVEAGRHFNDVYPLLWMSAGHHGDCDPSSADDTWLLAPEQQLAVLFDDIKLTAFVDAVLAAGKGITHAWIVTDSESRFEAARRDLPEDIEVMMLYRSYLESFVLNTRRS